MKVLHLTHHFWPCIGGIEKFVFDLAMSLQKNGIETKILCLNSCGKEKQKLKEKENVNGINVERIPFIDLKYYKIAFGTLKKIKDCDIVHVHNIGFFSDYLAVTKFLHKKKLVLNTHGGMFHTKKLGFVKKIYFNLWLKWVLKKFDLIIADSMHDFTIFEKIAPKEKIVLIGNAVDLRDFYNSGKKKEKNTFVFVGRFSSNKKIDDLIEVFAKVSEKRKDFSLKIAGTDFDNLKEKLLRKIREKELEKNVEIIENLPQKELIGLFAKTRYFVSASEYEGFGISTVEAMASECIPILNKIETFSTIIENNNGLIVEFKNHQKTAERVLDLMALPEEKLEKMASNARKSTERFSFSSVIGKIVAEYEKLQSGCQ